jgi:hypothetical protein
MVSAQQTSQEVAQLEQRAHESQDLIDSQLDSLIDSLSAYNETTQPLTQQVDELLRAEKNIQLLIEKTEQIQQYYTLIQQSYDESIQQQQSSSNSALKSALASVRSNDKDSTQLKQQSLESDPQAYIAHIHALSDALQFFNTEASTYKSSSTLQRQCKELLKKSQAECLTEIQRLFTSVPPLLMHNITWPVLSSQQYTILSTKDINSASQLIQCMSVALQANQQIASLIEAQRSTWLRAALKQQAHDGYKYNVSQQQISVTPSLQAGQLNRSVTADSVAMPPPAIANERIGQYVVGSHPSVFQWHFLLRLVQLEHSLLTQLLQSNDTSISSKSASSTSSSISVDSLLSHILIEPFAYFAKKQNESLKERSANKLLHLFDLIETQHQLLPQFETLTL